MSILYMLYTVSRKQLLLWKVKTKFYVTMDFVSVPPVCYVTLYSLLLNRREILDKSAGFIFLKWFIFSFNPAIM